MKTINNPKIQLLIGAAAVVAAIVTGIITGCSYESSTIMSAFACLGILSILCPLFSKINKKPVSYILYMAGNIVAVLIYLFVISKYEQIGSLYMSLFLVVVFLAVFMYDICIVNNDSVGKRVIYAFVMNLISHIGLAVALATVLTVSIIAVGV